MSGSSLNNEAGFFYFTNMNANLTLKVTLADLITASTILFGYLCFAYVFHARFLWPQSFTFSEIPYAVLGYDLAAMTVAVPVAWQCSRVGFFSVGASLFVGSLIGVAIFHIWYFQNRGFLQDTNMYPILFVCSGLYGVGASLIFRAILRLKRVTAFLEDGSSQRPQTKYFLISLVVGTCLILTMNHMRWIPIVN